MSEQPRKELDLDVLLVGGGLALAVLGTIMVGSASISLADKATGDPFFYLFRHLGALGIGAVGMAVALLLPIELWYRLNAVFLVAALGLLVAVLMPGLGSTVNGSSRWLALGPLGFQPSEPARLCLLVYLSAYAVRH
ncbi:MAG TPA: FtsW/RodA/SpoVE family cell cycle protein, partial [Gammaproteobacteria bacterium]|nr:FtsW/RodA/SpoVE family cell cycle protein [Gammaproteobacteria bacterium]